MALSTWEENGDVLDRKPAADYLHKLVTQRFESRHKEPGSGAVCVALEAEWGAGKTFFLERWAADLENQQHVVVRFNAWENDLSEDPLLGFMAALKEGLAPQFEKMPALERAKLNGVVKKAARAVIPAGKVIGKALIKKLTGIAIDEVADSLSDTAEASGESAIEAIPDALEAYFEHALTSHTDRQRAIRDLRRSIEELVEYLASHASVAKPLFVLVDELDRCRPDYAIRLLEGIKHLFNASGVCFVLATNLHQLSASAQAVYGSAFDGRAYLQRFFSFEYHLPAPDHLAYARMLVARSPLTERYVESVVPDSDSLTSDLRIATDFSLVSKTLGLSLRAQNQVFERAEAAALGLPAEKSLHAFYLFMLSAIFQKGGDLLQRYESRHVLIPEVWKRTAAVAVLVPFETMRDQRLVRSEVSTQDLFTYFETGARMTIGELSERTQAGLDYPESIFYSIFAERGKQPHAYKRSGRPSITDYARLVLSAGRALDGPQQA